MTNALSRPIRVYGPSPWIRLVFWGLFGPLSLGFVAMPFFPVTREAGYILAPLGVLIALGVRWFLAGTRLELSPEGIRSRNPGKTVETSWANVSGVLLGGDQPGFTTYEPMDGKGAYRLAAYSGLTTNGAPTYDAETRAWVVARRFIPLKSFGWHLKHGDLVSEVTRLAPQVHLPEALVVARQPKPPGKKLTLSQWLIFAGVMLSIVGFVVVASRFPNVGRRCYSLLLLLMFLISGLRTFITALSMFRKRAILMGILLVLLSGVLLILAVLPLAALLS